MMLQKQKKEKMHSQILCNAREDLESANLCLRLQEKLAPIVKNDWGDESR